MAAETPATRYAVVGNPVSHSLSPRIHARFAAQTGENLSYEAIELPRDEFEAGVRGLVKRGYAGLNVTLPFKREAREISDRLSPRAEDAGAVNTLTLQEDGITGDNTDGAGLVRDLCANLGISLASRRILLVGAGGAARGVLAPLLDCQPESVVIANRTARRAVDLAHRFAGRGDIRAKEFDALGNTAFDLVINATAAGLAGDLPPLPASVIAETTICYDLMYDLAAATAFVAWARDNGAAEAWDGLGMLVEQAAESFRLWRGVQPDSKDVLAMLRPQ